MLAYRTETFANDLRSCNWLFDFFAIGFDHISRYLEPPSLDDPPSRAFMKKFGTLEEELVKADGSVPESLWHALELPTQEQKLLGKPFLLRLFFLLQEIDRASADLNYFRYGLDASRWRGVKQYLQLNGNNLGKSCDGLVTIMPPRLGRPHPDSWSNHLLKNGWSWPAERGIHHHRFFENLSRVPSIAGCGVRHLVLPASRDLDSHAWPVLKVGMVPMLHELELHAPQYAQLRPGPLRIVPAGPGKFSIGNESPGSTSWNEALHLAENALTFLASTGVQVVVFPELTVPDLVLDHIKQVLRRLALAGESGIQLVLAGTFLRDHNESGIARNVAIVLNGTGQELYRQRKMQPYEMQPYEQDRYGLGPLFGESPAREDIECFPREIVVCDSPGAGFRIAVLICEDSCHQQPAISAVQQLMANLVMIPVMAGALRPDRQFSTSASALAMNPEAIVVVSNSAVLPAREWQREPPPDSSDPQVGIVSMPIQDRTYSSKWFISKYMEADNAPQVLQFSVGGRSAAHHV